MKYRYRFSMYFVQMFLGYLVVLLMFFIIRLIDKDFQGLWGATLIFIGSVAMYYKEYRKKYVELDETSMKFYSFRFRDITKKRALVFDVKYKDIYGLGVRSLPLIGVWAIVVEAKYLPHGMTISFCFKKHKELWRNLCRIVKEHNPDAYIDSRLEKYCEE